MKAFSIFNKKVSEQQKKEIVFEGLNTMHKAVEAKQNTVDIPYFIKAVNDIEAIERSGRIGDFYNLFKKQGGVYA